MPVHVRPATAEDLGTLVQFNAALARETEALTLDLEVLRRGVTQVLEDAAKGFYLVADEGSRVVGQLMVTPEWSDWRNADWWWIQSVYVAPDFRRRGVFRALYEATLERSKQAGAHGLRLYVERENLRAQSTYAALGMKHARYELYELGDE